MKSLIPLLSTILPIIASTLLIAVISVNLYFKIRRKFSISVNCWFCNSWTKVPYDDRNNFDCPTCLQYNGFTKDGDYNKIIPEQRDELMNKSTRVKGHKSVVSNGLCALCNNNQQLKIFQLANFVPLVDENYDVEIEHFQEQLEKAYKLCRKCDRVLKRTLDKQNAWMFGNRLKSMCGSGFSKIANQIKQETKKSLLAKFDGFLSVLLVLGVIFTTISSNKIFTKTLSPYMPAEYLTAYKHIVSKVNSSHVVDFTLLAPHFTKSIKLEPYSTICGTGLVYQVFKMIWTRTITATKMNHFLCWIILFLISWVRFNRNFSSYVLFVEAFCCVYLLATAFSKDEVRPAQKPSGKTMRKLVKNLEYTCTDFSDSSDFDNISSSSRHCANSSRDSNDYLNKSTYSTLDVPHTFTTAGNVLNSSFASARSSFANWDVDLNKSLNNLHLGFKSPKNTSSMASFALKRPKPVLSPPKLQTVNSWVAGGFWRDADGMIMPIAQKTNLSRSSSESSGFGSQHNENVHFAKSNYFGDFESDYPRLAPSPGFVFRRNEILWPRVGSPGLNPYQRPVSIENWSDRINLQATQSFRDLNLHSNN